MGLTVVYQGTRTILIEWNEPEASLYVLDHYEVQWGRNVLTKESKTTKKCYAWFKKLQTITHYLFKVRAVRKNGCVSKFVEVCVETKSVTGRVAKVAGVSAGVGAATVAMQVFYSVTFSVLIGGGAGVVAAESVEDKGKGAEAVAGTATGIAGAIGIAGFALGLLAAPDAVVTSPITAVVVASIVAIAETENVLDLDGYLERYPDDDNI